jgi:hypothetical protein
MDQAIAETPVLSERTDRLNRADQLAKKTLEAAMNLITPTPVFHSVYDALVFAYNFSSSQYPETTLGKLLRKKAEEDGEGGDLGTGKGLSGLDGAGQAGMILGAVHRLELRQVLVIEARFMKRTCPCRTCGHEAFTASYRLAIDSLAETMLSDGVVPTSADIRLRRELVYGHFGKRPHNVKLGKKYHLDRHTVGGYQVAITKALKALEYQAQETLHGRFAEAGMLETGANS